jgi:hypothetical protein
LNDFAEQAQIAVIDMASVFAQMADDAVSSGQFSQ